MKITFNHFSKVSNLTELDSAYFNSNVGIKSGENERVVKYNAPLRVYGYTNLKQHREIGLGIHKYTGTINGIYDINEDKLKLKRDARDVISGNSEERFTLIEKLIKSKGFNGYWVDSYNIVAIFVKVKVKEVD